MPHNTNDKSSSNEIPNANDNPNPKKTEPPINNNGKSEANNNDSFVINSANKNNIHPDSQPPTCIQTTNNQNTKIPTHKLCYMK